MNKFEFNDFFNQFVNILEEGGTRLRTEAEDFGQNFKSNREIKRLESSIRDDYVSVGLLVYELHKMGKSFDIEDFSSKFESIDQKKLQLSKLERESSEEDIFKNHTKSNKDNQHDLDYENTDDSYSDVKDEIICSNCGAKNTKYVAYCSSCGTEL